MWAKDNHTVFHDLSGATTWDSQRRIIVPVLQHVNGASKKLMFNLHSSPLLGNTIEKMMTCAEQTKELILKHEFEYSNLPEPKEGEELREHPPLPTLMDCTMVTDVAHNKTSWVQGEPVGPGASMLQPVFPARNKTEVRM